MWNGKNVLVAGGAGFTGSNLIERLLSLGAHVRATLYHKPAIIIDEKIEYVNCDLLNMGDCKGVVKDIECVFMSAASASGAAALASTPLVHVTPNIIMNSQMLEAAYFGKPVIATNVGGNSEGVIDGKNGYLIKPSKDELKEKLKTLIENKELRKKMGKEARNIYEGRFVLEKNITKIINLYKSGEV